MPYHPGSPEAALSHDDVLDKFARNTSWLFGERARATGKHLAETGGRAPVGEVIRILAEAETQPSFAQAV